MSHPDIFKAAQELYITSTEPEFRPPNSIIEGNILQYIVQRAGRGEYQHFSMATYALGDEVEMAVEHTKHPLLFQSVPRCLGRICIVWANPSGLTRLEYKVPTVPNLSPQIQRSRSTISIADLEASTVPDEPVYKNGFPIPASYPLGATEAVQLERLLMFEQDPLHVMAA